MRMLGTEACCLPHPDMYATIEVLTSIALIHVIGDLELFSPT